MAPIQQPLSEAGFSPLESLPYGALSKIAEVLADTTIVTSTHSKDVTQVTENVVDAPASNEWHPNYKDVRSLALTSTTLRDIAQRTLFKVAAIKTIATMKPMIREVQVGLIATNVLYNQVVSEFIQHIHPLITKPGAPDALDEHCFLRNLLKDSINALVALRDGPSVDAFIHSNRNSGVNFHTVEDQVITTTLQLCPNLEAARICFGEPLLAHHHHGPPPGLVDQRSSNRFGYASLLQENRPTAFKTLTLDAGAFHALTNLKGYAEGYPTGCPPSVERLTLVGNCTQRRPEMHMPYPLFRVELIHAWLSTNRNPRELKLVDDFDRMVKFEDNRPSNLHSQPNAPMNWNDVLVYYKNTLEVLEMGWHRPSALSMKLKFGESGRLACLPEMNKLKYLKVPLVYLGGDFIAPAENDEHLIRGVRVGLPSNLKRVDLLVVNPPRTLEERQSLTWRTVVCYL
ncbi:hypothetical protein B0T20DRAFT_448586 [Sordaria brevicollis]|uniref:Uncharacterized protein n=1 Tax=Sordaria brevicollis TaxID=83679 RepID=A0AAE0NVA7_SORBR|nr:hypothetical protein B0T20DRAFT_448586 [Sordaria brevicollis]